MSKPNSRESSSQLRQQPVAEPAADQAPAQAQEAEAKAMSISDLENVLSKSFASSAIKVYVNSLGKEVTFNEITVKEQKALTRIMSANQRRKDVVYDAECAMINKACATEGFDIRQCSEFDRLKLMIALYQANMMQNEVKFVCDECGAENKYKVDFEAVLKKLDEFDLAPKAFHYENAKFAFDFVIEYPKVTLVHDFHENYAMSHIKPVPKREAESDENMQNMDYVNLFIKSMTFTNKETKQSTDINFSNYAVNAYEKVLNKLPQDVLYSEDGVLRFIVKEMIQPLNESFDKHECWKCGTVHEKENANQAESFF